MTTDRQYIFKIGDRVAERPKLHGIFAGSKQAKAIAIKNHSQRYGTVIGYDTKVNSRGSRIKLLIVQWDHLKSPMTHARNRICPITELNKLTSQVIVPGE
jgi:hypothetical protein